MIDEDSLQERKAAMLPHLDERQRRLFAAAEARAAGRGGIAAEISKRRRRCRRGAFAVREAGGNLWPRRIADCSTT